MVVPWMSMSPRLRKRRRRAGLDLVGRCLDFELQLNNPYTIIHHLKAGRVATFWHMIDLNYH
jgi:hypothetical protein